MTQYISNTTAWSRCNSPCCTEYVKFRCCRYLDSKTCRFSRGNDSNATICSTLLCDVQQRGKANTYSDSYLTDSMPSRLYWGDQNEANDLHIKFGWPYLRDLLTILSCSLGHLESLFYPVSWYWSWYRWASIELYRTMRHFFMWLGIASWGQLKVIPSASSLLASCRITLSKFRMNKLALQGDQTVRMLPQPGLCDGR